MLRKQKDVSLVSPSQPWKVNGKMKATIANQSVENELIEHQRIKNNCMPSKLMDLISVLGTITLDSPGTHTMTLGILSDFENSKPLFRSVMLSPIND